MSYLTNKGVGIMVEVYYGTREEPVQFLERTLVERVSLTISERDWSFSLLIGRGIPLRNQKKVPSKLNITELSYGQD